MYACLPQYKLSPIPFKLSDQYLPEFTVQPTADPSSISTEWLDSSLTLLPPSDPDLAANDLVYSDPSKGPVIWAPRWEQIPSGFISLFLTNLGTHAPSYLYALGRELFHSDDIKIVSQWK